MGKALLRSSKILDGEKDLTILRFYSPPVQVGENFLFT